MMPQSKLSPISLRYIAALRSFLPRKTGIEFTYAEMGCASPDRLICLAASNPEGRFYGIVADDTARREAEEQAAKRGTYNVIFLAGSPSQILARLANGSALPPALDYLVWDESVSALSNEERVALYDLANTRMKPSGLFVSSYRAYDREDGALRFLVRELSPEMDDAQKQEFLWELSVLGKSFFAAHPDLAAKLKEATVNKAPQKFFALFSEGDATSETFDMLVAAGKREFLYAGDATLASNYVELSIPREAQDLIISCRKSPLYEPIKDFALNRTIRTDIWIKAPTDTSSSAAELFGGFAYGLNVDRDQIPLAVDLNGRLVDLSAPLYGKVLDLMALMPIGIGDALAHPSTKDEQPEKLLEVFQILVACGYVSPMRGTLNAPRIGETDQLRLVGSFNKYLDQTSLDGADIVLASQVAGCGITIKARDAFVLQAVNRAGLTKSVSALMPELRRIANTSAATAIIDVPEPTAEIAHAMIVDVLDKSLPKWYAYALLEAA